MRDYDFTIAAGGQERRDLNGNFIKVKTASVELRVIAENSDGQNIADLLMSEGAFVNLRERFQKVRLENNSASTTTATLIMGSGVVDDSQLSGQVSIGQGQTIQADSETVTTSAAEIVTANSSRRSVTIQNLDSANAVYIGGDNTLTTSNGLKIAPDAGIVIDKSSAGSIWAICAAGTPDIRIMQELD